MVAGHEIVRLMRLSRDVPAKRLLDETLAGNERTVTNLTRLMTFLVQNFGQDGSSVVDKYWKEIKPCLEDAGVQEADLKKIRFPFPRPGDKNFKSILGELAEEGHT